MPINQLPLLRLYSASGRHSCTKRYSKHTRPLPLLHAQGPGVPAAFSIECLLTTSAGRHCSVIEDAFRPSDADCNLNLLHVGKLRAARNADIDGQLHATIFFYFTK